MPQLLQYFSVVKAPCQHYYTVCNTKERISYINYHGCNGLCNTRAHNWKDTKRKRTRSATQKVILPDSVNSALSKSRRTTILTYK